MKGIFLHPVDQNCLLTELSTHPLTDKVCGEYPEALKDPELLS